MPITVVVSGTSESISWVSWLGFAAGLSWTVPPVAAAIARAKVAKH